jgi:two-component system, cell cycle response regulator CpdR
MARILVAEDEADLRALVRRALSEAGHVVEAAPDGAAALDKLEQAEPAFDLLLADIRMPIMDGIALALAVAASQPALKILLMTGFADQRERAQGLDTLIDDVLTKPFTLAELHAAVDRSLARAARG